MPSASGGWGFGTGFFLSRLIARSRVWAVNSYALGCIYMHSPAGPQAPRSRAPARRAGGRPPRGPAARPQASGRWVKGRARGPT